MQLDANNDSDRLRRLATIARYCTVLVLVVMFMGTHVPLDGNNQIVHSDKLMHFWAYLTLAFAAATTWDLSAGKLQGYQYFVVWLVCAVYGVADELLQIPVGRSCEAMDWVSDALGAAAGLALFRILRPLVYRLASFIPAAAQS